MKFSKILSIALLAFSSKAAAEVAKDDFLDNTDRAELFTLTDYNVPNIYITMEKEEFEELIHSASVNAFNMNASVPPPPPTGAPGNEDGSMGGPGGPGGGPGGPGGMPPEELADLILNPGTEEEENVKITDASLKFEINGEVTSIPSISISIGGEHTRNTPKVGFNLKCNKGKLFGRKVFRLRSNDGDATLMRSKLTCDMVNRLGLPSISANYARLYVNDEFMGFYVLMDQYKTSWIKQVYGDKEVKDLYQCKEMYSDLSAEAYQNCVNADDERPDDTEELAKFLATINAAKSRDEIEDIMDVDTFIQLWILEYLLGSGDHMLINGKNYYLYKQLNGVWTVLYYDFDSMFGVDLGKYTFDQETAPETPFTGWYFYRPIVDTLVKNDEASFLKNLQYVVDKVFNPDVLFPHIDNLKEWMTPYMIEDRTPVDGVLPGRVNSFGFGNDYDFEQFLKNTEYTSVDSAYGLKEWIQRRYDYVCATYDIICPGFEAPVSTVYEDETTTVTVEEETTVVVEVETSALPDDEEETTSIPVEVETTEVPDDEEETTETPVEVETSEVPVEEEETTSVAAVEDEPTEVPVEEETTSVAAVEDEPTEGVESDEEQLEDTTEASDVEEEVDADEADIVDAEDSDDDEVAAEAADVAEESKVVKTVKVTKTVKKKVCTVKRH